MTTYNVYCDESCHLENDHQRAMVLGALWCPTDVVRTCSEGMRTLKAEHGLDRDFEVKWTKVSPAGLEFYQALIRYFFASDALHFRALVVPDKTLLDHERLRQDHDTWYYKMYFDLLKVILEPDAAYRIYLDVKDTRSEEKVRKLHDVLCNNMYDFSRRILERVQQVRSDEVELMQLADLLIGVVSRANRDMTGSPAKLALVEQVRAATGYSLTKSTLLREQKLNVFRWRARELGS